MSFAKFKELATSPSPPRRESSDGSSDTFLEKDTLFEYTEPRRPRRWLLTSIHIFVLGLYTIIFLFALKTVKAKMNHGADVVYSNFRLLISHSNANISQHLPDQPLNMKPKITTSQTDSRVLMLVLPDQSLMKHGRICYSVRTSTSSLPCLADVSFRYKYQGSRRGIDEDWST